MPGATPGVPSCTVSYYSHYHQLRVPQIGEVLRTSLEDYFILVQNKFQDITANR